jgi:hypothetical protein
LPSWPARAPTRRPARPTRRMPPGQRPPPPRRQARARAVPLPAPCLPPTLTSAPAVHAPPVLGAAPGPSGPERRWHALEARAARPGVPARASQGQPPPGAPPRPPAGAARTGPPLAGLPGVPCGCKKPGRPLAPVRGLARRREAGAARCRRQPLPLLRPPRRRRADRSADRRRACPRPQTRPARQRSGVHRPGCGGWPQAGRPRGSGTRLARSGRAAAAREERRRVSGMGSRATAGPPRPGAPLAPLGVPRIFPQGLGKPGYLRALTCSADVC